MVSINVATISFDSIIYRSVVETKQQLISLSNLVIETGKRSQAMTEDFKANIATSTRGLLKAMIAQHHAQHVQQDVRFVFINEYMF